MQLFNNFRRFLIYFIHVKPCKLYVPYILVLLVSDVVLTYR